MVTVIKDTRRDIEHLGNMVQNEFNELSTGLKASLQERLKFEIAESIITEAPAFVYFRLFMIQQFWKQRETLLEKNPESPILDTLTETNVANRYRTIIFELINNLKMAHHTPGQLVLKQNDEVLDEEDDFLDDINVYFIMTGNYVVQSLMFDMKHKQAASKGGLQGGNVLHKIKLRSGDFFGEISLLFGCRRTASVKAKQYCECAYIEGDAFLQLLQTQPVLKQYLVKNVQKSYDDELRIFLVHCLRKVDYLAHLSEDVLTHLAMHMIAQQADKDTPLHRAGKHEIVSEMTIIYSGKLMLSTEVDTNTPVVLEYLGKGAVLDAHNFLTFRHHQITQMCLSSVIYYYLPFQKLQQVAQNYTALANALAEAQRQSRYNKLLDMNTLDYLQTSFDFAARYPEKEVKPEQLKRVQQLRLQMKNAVLHQLAQQRTKRVKSFTNILDKALKKLNKKKELEALNEKESQEMTLLQRLDTLENGKKRISDERFERLKKAGTQLSKETLQDTQRQINKLKGVISRLASLEPIEEEEGLSHPTGRNPSNTYRTNEV